MENIQDYLKTYKIKQKKGSERNDILRQIYSFYDTEQEVLLTKKSNWKRYITFLKEIKQPDSKENQSKFKRSKKFIRKSSSATIAYFLSHIPQNDLYYVLSVAKDKSFRKESVGLYIVGLSYPQSNSLDNKIKKD